MRINNHEEHCVTSTDFLPRVSPLQEGAGNVFVYGCYFGLVELSSWSDMGGNLNNERP